MKLYDIITEDVADEKRLDLIADQLVNIMISHAKRELSDDEMLHVPTHIIPLGRVRQVVDSKTLGPLYGRLGMLKFGYTFFPIDEGRTHAEVDWQKKRITIFVPVNGRTMRPSMPKMKLHSSIVHELRHALDYSLSKGKAITDKPVKGASVPKSRKQFGSYEREAAEVNARASEAMLLVRRYIVQAVNRGRQLNNEQLKKIIMRSLREKRLTNIFQTETPGRPTDNKQFRQLFNRMLKYADDFIEELRRQERI